jgi:type I restriction enzyme M protein
VVSLPQETFYSAGASVKASLLFMQKFTEKEAADFEAKRRTAIDEVDANYQPEIEAETARIQKIIEKTAEKIKKAKLPTQAARKRMAKEEIKAAVEAAKIAAKQVPEWKNRMAKARRELRAYEKRMADTKAREARQLLKERFDYPVFLYDAQHVGLTATGEQDVCELYHSDALGLPADMKPEETALEQYRCFCKKPEQFVESNGGNK